jgi:dTDP-4-amino-4,6-dideoxygalactose transaminase
MAVPLIDINAQNFPLKSEFNDAFEKVLQSGFFIMGPAVKEFEDQIAAMLGIKHAIAVSSGTDALLLALMALDIQAGDEIICPSFTFFATAGAIARVGAVPVFVDVCPVCFNIDINAIRKKITSRTRAIIPVHLFGQSADMDGILAVARENNLMVIEDAAQSIGAYYKKKACGGMGQFGCYSFFPTKNLGGMGDGGMLVTQDDNLAAYARKLRVHGMDPKYYHHFVGGNFRMDTLQAALLQVKLPHYQNYTLKRQANAKFYHEALSNAVGVALAKPEHCKCLDQQQQYLNTQQTQIVLPVAYAHNEHIWNQFTIRVLHGKRQSLMDYLKSKQIGAEIYYPVTLDQQACFAHLPESSKSNCEISHQLAQEVLSLPIYPELSKEQLQEVVLVILEWLNLQ